MATANQKKEDYAKHWFDKIDAANKHFEKWEKRFQCRILNDYIEGKQRAYGPGYVLNLIYSSIKIKKPSLLFSRPSFNLTPKPWKSDWNVDNAITVTKLREDTLNSFIQDDALKFAQEIDMAILDSWSYFGLVEVGYDAKWVKNPNAGKPVLKSDYYELESSDKPGKIITEPDEIPEKEYIYFKRIPAHRFRVGGTDSHDLERCSWSGYYEFVRMEDIYSAKKYFKNLDEKDWPTGRSDDFYETDSTVDEKDFSTKGDFAKVWKIWDHRAKNFIMLLDSVRKCIYTESYERLPLFGLRYDLRRSGWYPIPVIYNWKSPQDEINESRDTMRQHRRRARQHWQVKEGMIEDDEKEKFINAPSSTLVTVKQDDAIRPIINGPLDSSVINSLQIATDEFDKISGTSNNQRGVSDRTTATEASTIETRTRIREETDQGIVAEWLCKIAKEALLQISERFSEDFWIKRSLDEGQMAEEIENLGPRYELIQAGMLAADNGDFDVNCTVTSLSPVTNDLEKKKFFEFMSVLQNFPILSMHPTVIREAAEKCGYRNEQVIKHLQQMAHLAMIAKIEEGQSNMQGQSQGLEGGNMAQNVVANNTPPAQEEIRQQLENQMPVQ